MRPNGNRVILALGALWLLAGAGEAAKPPPAEPAGDAVTVTVGQGVEIGHGRGRLLLLFAPGVGGWDTLGAPFWSNPQPVYSIGVDGVTGSSRWVIDDSAQGAYPGPISELDGIYRVRAVLDLDTTTSGFAFSDHNWMSAQKRVRFRRGADDRVALEIVQRLPVEAFVDTEHVKEARLCSEKLSAFFGRDIFLRAGVILPAGHEAGSARRYPTVYEIPGFGEQHEGAWERGRAPDVFRDGVVWVVLDPDGPFGHHLFFNSDNNGPVGDALIEEFIPYLEETYGLVSSAAGRVVTGHSSGGFSSAWLQIRYPEFFGGCWSTGPDPLDFRALQAINIYEDAGAYVDANGQARPSVQMGSQVVCTIEQENRMENALDPSGASGQQWDSWMACFSPRGDDGLPIGLWDATTGALNPEIVRTWRRRDPRLYLESEWESIGPLLRDRLHMICGANDNFSLNKAALHLRGALEALDGWPAPGSTTANGTARGYVELVEGGTHFNLGRFGVTRRINDEIQRHFEVNGLLEEQ